MRKWKLALWVVGIFFALSVLGQFDDDNSTANNPSSNPDSFTKSSLNVSFGPSTKAGVSATLNPGEKVKVLEDSIGWKRVQLVERDANKTGWVPGRRLSDLSSFDDWQYKQNEKKLGIESSTDAQFIPDIMPADVYLNLEERGFSTDKDLGSRLGNFWRCILRSGGLSFRVAINSKDVNKVQSIRATVTNSNIDPGQVERFFKYLASVLFLDSSDGQSRLNNWIEENFNRRATTSVGPTQVRITAPSKIIRTIRIDSDLNDGI